MHLDVKDYTGTPAWQLKHNPSFRSFTDEQLEAVISCMHPGEFDKLKG